MQEGSLPRESIPTGQAENTSQPAEGAGLSIYGNPTYSVGVRDFDGEGEVSLETPYIFMADVVDGDRGSTPRIQKLKGFSNWQNWKWQNWKTNIVFLLVTKRLNEVVSSEMPDDIKSDAKSARDWRQKEKMAGAFIGMNTERARQALVPGIVNMTGREVMQP